MPDRFFGMHTIYGDVENQRTPYMTRLWLGRLRLHIFHRGDADPDCHDHPWDFWTFPLTSYVEEVAEPVWMSGPLPMQYHVRRQVVHAFRFHYRPATHCHRVLGRVEAVNVLQVYGGGVAGRSVYEDERHCFYRDRPGKIITIVWQGRSARNWGFLKNLEGKWCWTPWRDYVFGGGKHAPCEPKKGSAE